MDKILLELGPIRSNHEPIVYYSLNNLSKLYVGVYVDDLLIARSTNARITDFKERMKALFDITNLGLLKSYLGILVKQVKGEITLSQRTFTMKIIFDFTLQDCNSSQTPLEVRPAYSQKDSNNQVDSSTYKSLMGSLRYLTYTRPDLMFFIGYLNRYLEDPYIEYFVSAKHVLRYVKRIVNFGLKYRRGGKLLLVGYCDSGYGGDLHDKKSTLGVSFWEKTL